MKKSLFFLTVSWMLTGCYSTIGAGTAVPLGKHGVVGSTVSVGSDGRLHGNVGVGTAIRL
jgi:serine acetyltransferase